MDEHWEQQPHDGRGPAPQLALPSPHRFTVPATPPSAGLFRQLLQDWLRTIGWPTRYTEELIAAANEAMSHAIACVYPPDAASGTVTVLVSIELAGSPSTIARASSTPERGVAETTPLAADAVLWQARFEITAHGMWSWNMLDAEALFQPDDVALTVMGALAHHVEIVPTSTGTHVTLISDAINRAGIRR